MTLSAAMRLSLAVLCVAVAASCTAKPESLMLGKWSRYSLQGAQPLYFYPATIVFFKDGTVSLVGDAGMPLTATGNYKFVDRTHMRIHPQGVMLGSVVVEVAVSRDQLVLTFPMGEVAKYRKLEAR